MNERVKELRKHLGLSGEKFGEKLGVRRSVVSRWESGVNNLTEQSIKSICREFNVNEQWLRTGEGDMFNSLDTVNLEDIATDLEPIELDILKAYFSLDKDLRRKAIAHFQNSLKDN